LPFQWGFGKMDGLEEDFYLSSLDYLLKEDFPGSQTREMTSFFGIDGVWLGGST